MATADLGLGRDITCTTSLRTGRFSNGPRLVAEALYRRFSTPRGTLRGGEDEDNYGLDLTETVGSVVTASDIASLPGRIRAEAQKDERLSKVEVTVVRTNSGSAVSFDVTIEGETAEGEFTLVLGVNDVTVELLGVTS